MDSARYVFRGTHRPSESHPQTSSLVACSFSTPCTLGKGWLCSSPPPPWNDLIGDDCCGTHRPCASQPHVTCSSSCTRCASGWSSRIGTASPDNTVSEGRIYQSPSIAQKTDRIT